MAAQLTQNIKDLIMADFHAGLSQNGLAIKYEKSPATINKLCKGVVPKNVEKVNTLTRIKLELAEQSECEVNAIHKEVDLRTSDMQFFRAASLKIAQKALHKIDNDDLSMFEIHKAQEVIGKGKENIYGKIDTAVQINNTTQQENVVTYRWQD